MIRESHPQLSEELLKIAQEIATPLPSTPTQDAQQPAASQNGLNPNIDNKYVQQTPGKTELHKVTLQVNVPENTNEMELINAIIPELSNVITQKGFKLVGYSFDERSRG